MDRDDHSPPIADIWTSGRRSHTLSDCSGWKAAVGLVASRQLWHLAKVRALLAISLPTVLVAACGVIGPEPPDFDGRSRQIQMLAFGREIVNEGHLLGAHETVDQRNLTWVYRIRPEQREELSKRCIRATEATQPSIRPFTSMPSRAVPACVIWEGTDAGSRFTILVSETSMEIREVANRPVRR